MLGVNGNPVLVTTTGEEFTRYVRSGAAGTGIGKVDVDGTTIRWGIYTGGQVDAATGGTQNVNFFHFVSASQSLPQSALPGFSGTFTKIQNFSSPITEAGWRSGTGNVTTNIVINNGTLTTLNLGVLDWMGRQWSASNTATASVADFVANGIKVGGTVNGDPLNATGSKVSGIPVGATGSSLIGSYTLRSNDNIKNVTGSFFAR